LEGRTPATAPDVENPLTGAQGGTLDRLDPEWRDLRVDQIVQRHPLRTGHLVPVFDLLGVGAGGFDYRHRGSLLSLVSGSWFLFLEPSTTNLRKTTRANHESTRVRNHERREENEWGDHCSCFRSFRGVVI